MRELLPTLIMISKINPGEKLIVRSKHISVDTRWAKWCRRMWDGEGRETTIQRLTEIYSELRQKVSILLYETDNERKDYERSSAQQNINSKCKQLSSTNRNMNETYRILQSVANALGGSYKGIKNLTTTYNNDSNTQARLESIMDNDIKDIYKEIINALPSEYKPAIYMFNEHLNERSLKKMSINPIKDSLDNSLSSPSDK